MAVGADKLTPRQREIMGMLRARGHVLVAEIARRCAVTPQSVRRDLLELEQSKLVERVHGGAIITDSIANLSYPARLKISTLSKDAIGHAAAELIPDGSSLFINVGTTTEAVARYLMHRNDLLVATNNINVVNIFRGCEKIKVSVAAGTVRDDGAVTGESAVQFFSQFLIDYALIGASALDEGGTLLDFDAHEVQVAHAIIENSRKVILVADAVKFQRRAPICIADIARIDYFVTDSPPPKKFAARCKQSGVQVIIAPPQKSRARK